MQKRRRSKSFCGAKLRKSICRHLKFACAAVNCSRGITPAPPSPRSLYSSPLVLPFPCSIDSHTAPCEMINCRLTAKRGHQSAAVAVVAAAVVAASAAMQPALLTPPPRTPPLSAAYTCQLLQLFQV